jgi:hypothetical protein
MNVDEDAPTALSERADFFDFRHQARDRDDVQTSDLPHFFWAFEMLRRPCHSRSPPFDFLD